MNRKMLTLEDVNSIISHFGKGFSDYYVLDTSELTEAYWFAYDFIDVCQLNSYIEFRVNNSLWTGAYHILDSNIENPTVTIEDNLIIVTGTGLEWCILVLELSPEFEHSTLFDYGFYPEFSPVIRPFYEDVDLVMGFMDSSTDEGVANLSVTDLITSESLTTDNDGLILVESHIDKAGDYDYQLQAVNNNVTVAYNYPYQRIKTELPVRLVNDSLYRLKKNTISFEFLFDDDYLITEDMLFGDNEITLIVDNTEYSLNSYSDNSFDFIVPIKDTNYCNMRLRIGGNNYLPKYDLEFLHSVTTISLDTGNELKTELESEDCAGIVLFTGTELNTNINIFNDVTVLFNSNVTSTSDAVFTVKADTVLTLKDSSFNGKTLVILEDGTLNLDNCNLQHCTGTVIKGVGDLNIDNTGFIDNLSCIDVKGNVEVVNCLFDLSDISYLDTGNVAFIHAYDELLIDYCEFNLDLTGLTSLGLSYVLLYLGKDCTVNNVKSKDLMLNEVFPVKKNTSHVDVESEHYHIQSKNNKCMIWTIDGTNMVYSNQLEVDYVQ